MNILSALQRLVNRVAVAHLACVGLLALFVACGSEESEPGVLSATRPSATASATANTPRTPPLGDSYRMVIEKIGVDAPVDTYGLDENAFPIVPTGDDAAQVVAWYDFSAHPGMGTNAVFAGHVTWFGAAVFEKLDSIAVGDSIVLRGDNGAEAVYRVTSNEAIEASDPKTLEVMRPTPKDTLTIITCGGTFYDTGDPVYGGDYTQRTVVQAELVSVS